MGMEFEMCKKKEEQWGDGEGERVEGVVEIWRKRGAKRLC